MTRHPSTNTLTTHDTYQSLLGDAQWNRLHPAIKRRFSNVLRAPASYTGIMDEIYLSTAGKLLAQICRLIGTPLALYSGTHIPMDIHVYENTHLKGMTWDRYYLYPNKPTNRVISTKCIRADMGLVELVGFGFGMQLKTYERDASLFFESTRFFVQLGKYRLSIPELLSPGKTVVVQSALDDKRFTFSLDVKHPVLGKVFSQKGTFHETSTERRCDDPTL